MPVRARPDWEVLLAPDEAARAEAIPGGGRRNLFVTSRAAQRLIACQYTGRPARRVRVERTCDRCGADHGRPRIVGAGYDYSVAHTRRRVLIGVVARGLVGVDLDTVPEPGVPERLVARTATPDERTALSQLPPHELPEAFTRLWSRKEAAVKLTGHGLAARLDRIGVRGELALPQGDPAEDWPLSQVHLMDVRVEGHVAAIASTQRITELTARSLPAPATAATTTD
ncbi:4'-phosphopantetheinyl transferase family protein [Streptomyces sp. NPDC000878]